jgi:hypothetical protein
MYGMNAPVGPTGSGHSGASRAILIRVASIAPGGDVRTIPPALKMTGVARDPASRVRGCGGKCCRPGSAVCTSLALLSRQTCHRPSAVLRMLIRKLVCPRAVSAGGLAHTPSFAVRAAVCVSISRRRHAKLRRVYATGWDHDVRETRNLPVLECRGRVQFSRMGGDNENASRASRRHPPARPRSSKNAL